MTATRAGSGVGMGAGRDAAAYAAQVRQAHPLPTTSANDRCNGASARPPEKPGARQGHARGVDNGARARPAADAAMNEVLAKADLRAGGREDLDHAAGLFASHYLNKDPNASGDDSLSGDADGGDARGAPAVHHDGRFDAQAAPAARPPAPLAATLTADIVGMLSVIDKDGRRAVRMDLRHARLPKTSVILENLPERLQVTFECGEAGAMDLLGKETPRLAENLALRRKRDCSVLVNTLPPESETRHRSDVAAPAAGDPAEPATL